MEIPLLFRSEIRDKVKKLPGFRPHHRVPDHAGPRARAFLLEIARPLLEGERERQFRCFRETFQWKRKEIAIVETPLGFAIETPSFSYSLSLRSDPAHGGAILWERTLAGLSGKLPVGTPHFFDLFPVKFDSAQTAFAKELDLEAAIDRLEEKALPELRIDYDSLCTRCEIRLARLPAKIILTRAALTLEREGSLSELAMIELLTHLQSFFFSRARVPLLKALEC